LRGGHSRGARTKLVNGGAYEDGMVGELSRSVAADLASCLNLVHPSRGARSNASQIAIGLPTNLWRAEMRRREFIAGLAGAATLPMAVRAQQAESVRRIAVLMPYAENDPEANRRVSTFTQALADLGWTVGRNMRLELRFGVDTNMMRALAHELVGLQPDVILTGGSPATAALQREAQTIPIVFVTAVDPVASGIVPRLDRPGGNFTGFALLEPALGGKWVELLSEIAPRVKRAAIMFNPDTSPAPAYMPSVETAARSLKLVPITTPVRSDVEIETAIVALGREPGGGLVVMPDVFMILHRMPTILAAARNNLPAVYDLSAFARDGGLLSYGIDRVDTFRRAASYVDRILRGEKTGDLPVQPPVKHELVINLKTAKALGLTIPETLLATADEVIQ
jgi:putative tryptophan/tyrosine transport system substrate-binding protein